MISSLRNQIRSLQGASVRLALLRILGLGLVTVVWLGAQNELKATKIKKVAVVYRDHHGMHLLSEREISRVVALKAKRSPRGIMHREKALRSQPSLVGADLSLGLDGILCDICGHIVYHRDFADDDEVPLVCRACNNDDPADWPELEE